MKRFFVFVSVAALLGNFLVVWLAPKTIAWYFEPPVEIGINCRPAAEWAMQKLQWAQAAGLLVGAIVGVLVWSFFQKKNRPSEAPKA